MNTDEAAVCAVALDNIEEGLAEGGAGWLDAIRRAERNLDGLPHTGEAHWLCDSLSDAKVNDPLGMIQDTRRWLAAQEVRP